MSDKTPLYRNLVLERAQSEGCPAEVTKEAIEEALARPRPAGDEARYTTTEMHDAVAYGYTAGRVARWDALVKGSPTLVSAILRQVHEFFHDEPFGQHDGTAGECTDCPTVAALAADAASAYYSDLNPAALVPTSGVPDVYAEDVEEDWDPAEETLVILGEPETMAALAEAAEDPTLTRALTAEEVRWLADHPEQGEAGARALHTSVPGEWRDGTGPA